MAATRMFLKTNSKISFQLLRSPTLAAPQLTKSISEALNQKSPQTISELRPCEFLGISQKLFADEAGFVKTRDCFYNNVSSVGGALFAQRAATEERQRIEVRGCRKQRIDEEDEDEDEVDEDFDDGKDELGDDFDGSFCDDSESGDDDFDDDIKSIKEKHAIK